MVDRSRKERRCYVYTLRCNVWGEECEADVMEETIIVLMQVGGRKPNRTRHLEVYAFRAGRKR